MCKGPGAVCSKPLALGAEKSCRAGLVVVAAVAVDLAANFAARPARAVNVYVSSTGANRFDQFWEFPGRDTALIREVGYVYRRDGAGDLGRWRRTRLRSCRTIAEIGAKEHADWTSHGLLSKVNVRLLNGAFEVVVSELPFDLRAIFADARAECSIAGGRDG